MIKSELRDRELLSGRADISGVDIVEDGDDFIIKVIVSTNPQCVIEMDMRIENDAILENGKRIIEGLQQ